jgi:hypothetical protein
MDPLSFQRRIDRYTKMLPDTGDPVPAVYLRPSIALAEVDIPAPGGDMPQVEPMPDDLDAPVWSEAAGWVEEPGTPGAIVIELHPDAAPPEIDPPPVDTDA